MPNQIRFAKALYERAGVEEAVDAYSAYAVIEMRDDGSDFVVDITANDAAMETSLADHFGNHALFASLSCKGASQ